MASPVFHPPRAASLFAALALSLFCGLPHAALHPLFKAAAGGSTPDTLEVFVMYVEFGGTAPETDLNDEAGTTGHGLFGTDKDTSYTLDPNGVKIRSSRDYLEKHFEFARNYFDKVSGGRLVIVDSLFPKPDVNGLITPLRLSKRMKVYNPAIEDKSAKQKIAEFEAQHAQALMTFVCETATMFDSASSGKNPFKAVFTTGGMHPSPHRYRAFMIFHAGHSRLIDGGTLGFAGANTPNDFTDFFINKPDFAIMDSSTETFLPGGKPSAYRADSLGVLVNSKQDTITEFMMLSEAASQDKANWGINGILVNQLSRQMGMPDLFDVVKGIPQLGYFDVMDFAGYNTLNGFMPVFPSAWTRAFMGWDTPVEASRGSGPYTEMTLNAADQPGTARTRTVKVPLNEREYLLVENRQRAARDSLVTIYYSKLSGPTESTFGLKESVSIPYAFLDSIFLDSLACTSGPLCGSNKKKPNTLKPRGIITGASHYDIGLPGNGLLVWHVNDWSLDAFLKYDLVNAYLGDTNTHQYKGLELVEADGIPSIGKQFTDPLGQPAFDYGTAQDMFPHVFRRRVNPPKDTAWRAAPETLSVIGSYGFANTNSWNDGRTHIKLQALLSPQPLYARAVGGFTGDSVFTLRDSALTLRVWWPNDSSVARPAGSVWPVRTAPAGNPQAVNILHAANGKGPYVVSAADTGLLQTYAANGMLALAARDTVRGAARYDSASTILTSSNVRSRDTALVNSLIDTAGKPIGACVVRDSALAMLTSRSLQLIRPVADSLNGTSRSGGRVLASIPMRGAVGPMAWGGRVFAVDSGGMLRWYDLNADHADSVALPARAYHAMAGLRYGPGGDSQIVVAGAQGAAVRVDPVNHGAVDLKPKWGTPPSGGERFSVVTSDFDRDGEDDVFLLGSRGSGLLFHTGGDSAHAMGATFTGFPQQFQRSINLLQDSLGRAYKDTTGHVYATEDPSSPALADLNRDGHPDIVFSGTNAVYAVDWHGAWLTGWPFLPQEHQSVGLTYANRRYPQTVINSTPLVLSLRGSPAVLLGSPDGLIYAVDNTGKRLGYSSYTADQKSATGVLMTDLADWPLSAGGLSLDTTVSPYMNLTLAQLDSTGTGDLELLAQTASGGLNVWSVRGSQSLPGRNWLMPGGDPGRAFHLDAATLGAPLSDGVTDVIQEFHLFPSPVRDGRATVHLKIGSAAVKARVRIFSLVGHPVVDASFADLASGLQPFSDAYKLDLSRLGPDVYSVLCEVWFADGKKALKWERVGVVR